MLFRSGSSKLRNCEVENPSPMGLDTSGVKVQIFKAGIRAPWGANLQEQAISPPKWMC